jgi:ABC transporter substrate binding protein
MWAMTRLPSMFAVRLLAAPLVIEAQPAKVPVIGTLAYGAPDSARLAWWKALREALQELGYVEGQSIAFEALWAEGRVDRLPGLAGIVREDAEAGGLFSYAVSYPALFRRAATYVDKILKGAKPADLPVEQPTKLELVINLKTAKALALTIPPAVLARADHLLE